VTSAAAPRIGWRRSWLPPHVRRRILAAALAGAAVVLAIASVHRPAPTVRVALAARDLTPGTRLAPGDIRIVGLPVGAAPAGAVDVPSALVGRVLADGVRAREPLIDLRLAGRQRDAGLAPGQVAAPVRLADPGVTPLLHPGLVVDVLVAANSPTGAADTSPSPARIVARGVRVLAVPVTGASSVSTASSGDPGGTLVVLAVNRADAQELAGAEAGGRLSVTISGG
jgi:pilus assembly protein CpaB